MIGYLQQTQTRLHRPQVEVWPPSLIHNEGAIVSIPHYQLRELYEARKKAHAYAVAQLHGEQTTESRHQFEAAMTDVERLTREIQVAERGYESPRSRNLQSEFRHAEAFGRYLRRGMDSLSAEQRQILIEKRDENEGNQASHINAGGYSGLGFFVPTGFVDMIEQATKYFAPLLNGDVCRVMETATGQALPFPTSNDTNQVATLIAESTQVSEQDATASQITFTSYKYTTGVVRCSLELLQDSAFDLEAWLAERFGERWGRAIEKDATTGAGVSGPTGMVTAILSSGVSPVIATGDSESTGGSQTGTNSVGYSDLVNLEHSVDPTYRRGAKYMFHDLTLAAIKKILDKYGRPLWTPGIAVGEPSTINGYPYVINQSMDQIGASKNTIIFGDFSKFIIRKVKDLAVMRLTERYADFGQVGYLGFARWDSNLIDAGTHPLNILQQHS